MAAVGARTRPITTDAVVDAALAIVDERGPDQLSLAAVARVLGCHVTSLYSHVDSLDDLLVRVLLEAQRTLADALWNAALGRSGVDSLRALADVYRRFGEAHPERVRLLFASRRLDDRRLEPAVARLAEPIRATLRSFGLDDGAVRHTHRAFSAAMRGFIVAQAHGTYASDADATFEHLVTLFVIGLEGGRWPAAPAGTGGRS